MNIITKFQLDCLKFTLFIELEKLQIPNGRVLDLCEKILKL